MSISSTKSQKSQKSSKSSTTSTATKAFVQQSVKLLNDTHSQLAALPNATLAVDKRKVAKFRKGAEGIIPKIGTLIQNAGLDGGPLSVADMLANLEQGQTLAPLLQQLESVTSTVGGMVFGAHGASRQTAMHRYAILQRMSLNDPALAESLQPIAKFMAYRHPLTTDGEPTTPAKKASAKLQKAQKRAERAQSALTFANSLLGGTTSGTPVAAPTAGATETATATAPATVAAVADPAVTTAAPAATTGH